MLLVTANFKEQGLGIDFLNGPRTDFGMQWYSQTGDTLVKTMVINSIFMPVIIELVGPVIRYIMRLKD